jgi:LacI family transcriptional regulator
MEMDNRDLIPTQRKSNIDARKRAPAGAYRAATIADVAACAGVAPMTVSRVVNGIATVRPERRKAVQRAIAKLKYRPNLAAQTLARVEQIRIGLLYCDLGAAFLSELLVGSLTQARLNHVELVVSKCEPGRGAEQGLSELLAAGIDGVMLPPPLCDYEPIQKAIVNEGTSAVAIASARPRKGISSVRIDDCAAAASMTRHIVSLGHERIGFIKGAPDQPSSELRFAGYKLALAEAKIPLVKSLVRQGHYTYRSGLKAADQLLTMANPPTAIFASNDDMASATVAVAHRHHLDVPNDLTVCGFDDTELSRSIWPELTTVRQPIADMSRAGLLLLIKKIVSRRKGYNDVAESTLMEFSLVFRDSAGHCSPLVR